MLDVRGSDGLRWLRKKVAVGGLHIYLVIISRTDQIRNVSILGRRSDDGFSDAIRSIRGSGLDKFYKLKNSSMVLIPGSILLRLKSV